jgi:hypothetical protein
MGKPVQKIMKGLGLAPKMPEMPQVQVSAAKKEDDGPVDGAAQRAAKERIEQEKLRKGRRSLRTDVATAGGGGAGLSVNQ